MRLLLRQDEELIAHYRGSQNRESIFLSALRDSGFIRIGDEFLLTHDDVKFLRKYLNRWLKLNKKYEDK